jgi:hypothetical protein
MFRHERYLFFASASTEDAGIYIHKYQTFQINLKNGKVF